jgi:hypothetical protein
VPFPFQRGAKRLLAATILIAAACNSNEVLPVEPVPEPRPDLAGSTYVLHEVNGLPAPFLVSDHTYTGDGTRTRFWIIADTLRFGPNRSASRHRSNRQLDETPGYPGNTADWMTYRNGLFSESGEFVVANWATLGAIPIPVGGGTDTLLVRDNGLVLRVKHPGSCYYCGDGPTVEYLYVRR